MDQERGCLEVWPLQELVVYTVLWPCAMIGVSSPGAFPPSMASHLPCLDSPSAPAKTKLIRLPPNPLFEVSIPLPGLLLCLFMNIHRLPCLCDSGTHTQSFVWKYHVQMLSMVVGGLSEGILQYQLLPQYNQPILNLKCNMGWSMTQHYQ